jgi:hypothetical protein
MFARFLGCVSTYRYLFNIEIFAFINSIWKTNIQFRIILKF